ncbi:MAG: branched-chain amino acid ABC transporter permease [Dongiaceae bacterium]
MSCPASLAAQFFPSLFNGLAIGAIYALIALGLSMVYGILNLINFAHGEVFMVGAFAALGVLTALGTGAGGGTPVLLAALAGLAAAAAGGLAAMLLERLAYRLRRAGAPRHAAMISGLGASILLQESFALLFGRGNLPVPPLLPVVTLVGVGGGRITNRMVLVFAATAIMLVLLDRLVTRTRLGRGMRAMAQDPRAAALLGVDIPRVVLWTFLVGGLCAGLGGFLYGLYFGKVGYLLGFVPGLKGLTAAVLGGVGNLPGAVVGGLLLGLLENFGVICLPSQLKDVVGFGALILVLLLRPQGLLGERIAPPRRS